MYRIVLVSTSGMFTYYTDSVPCFESMNTAMKEIHHYAPAWLISAGYSEA